MLPAGLVYDAASEWHVCSSLSLSIGGFCFLKKIKFRVILFMEESSGHPRIEILSPRLYGAVPVAKGMARVLMIEKIQMRS